jgi:outer membrane protein assembly factor BamB
LYTTARTSTAKRIRREWKAAYGPETQEKFAPGSRSTPTVDGDRLYIMSGLGAVYCLSAVDGKVLWSVDAAKVFGGTAVQWVFSESLLVHGDVVYATPGGPDASVVALNKMTGETVWTSKGLSLASAYCSPTIFTYGGREVLVTMLAASVVGVEAKTGATLWTHTQKVPYDIHANTPVGEGNILFYTSETGGGALDVAADGGSVTQRWTAKEPEVLHHGVILHGGHLYGGGFRSRDLYCVDFKTGATVWNSEEIGEASIIFAEDMLYLYESPKKGLVHLVKASPEKYERMGVFQVPDAEDKHWAHPAIANGLLFIRYNGILYAYDIKAK